jgi:hypothetical protein
VGITTAKYIEIMNKGQHGTTYGYGQGCHCSDCRRAMRDYRRSKRGTGRAKIANSWPSHEDRIDTILEILHG